MLPRTLAIYGLEQKAKRASVKAGAGTFGHPPEVYVLRRSFLRRIFVADSRRQAENWTATGQDRAKKAGKESV